MLHDKIALGTVQFGLNYGIANQAGQTSEAEVGNIISLAKNGGVKILDTAIGYGESELVLGNVGVTSFQLITKLPGLPSNIIDVEKWVFSQLQGSLSRLKIPRLYAVLLHRPSDLFGAHGSELVSALLKFKHSGAVEKLGVSIYEPDDLAEITQLFDIELVQAPLNVVDRRLEQSGWLGRLKAADVEVHTRSSLLQGLLLIERKNIPSQFEKWSCLWDKWHLKLIESRVSALAACLAYPLSLPGVDRVILGVNSCGHLQEIINASITHDIDTSFMTSSDSQLINPALWTSS
jgi:aryl-alcohol dehydrogenase-like predicted oxidoreductase